MHKDSFFLSSAFYIIWFLSLLSGCSLPRLIVLNDPLTPSEHLNLGVAYEKGGEFTAALKEYKLAAPQLPLAYLYMGNVFFAQNDRKQAERNYRRALQEDPQNADALNNLAWLYYVEGKKLAEAEQMARRALELNPAKAALYRDTLDQIANKLHPPSPLPTNRQ